MFLKAITLDLIFNYAKDGELGCMSPLSLSDSVESNMIQTKHAYINVQTAGDLSSFRWFQSDHHFWPRDRRPNEQLIEIHYSSLNFRDVMLATGKIPPDSLPGDTGFKDCVLGFEFVGRDETGRRVMGMAPCKSLATSIVLKSDYEYLFPIPEYLSFEEAATLSVVYMTCYYGFRARGRMKGGETVLIHCGAGGVGLAALRICQSMGCEIYTTVGSKEKREFVKKTFPQITDGQIFCSRDTSFEREIMRKTRGRGVDLVLNSLDGKRLHASLRVLRYIP